jgi:hypothetical protein
MKYTEEDYLVEKLQGKLFRMVPTYNFDGQVPSEPLIKFYPPINDFWTQFREETFDEWQKRQYHFDL